MDDKKLIKIINEELSEFDFLGNDARQEEDDVVAILSNEDLQKQFICDTLVRKEQKIKELGAADAWIGGDWEMGYSELDEASQLKIEYDLKVEYLYDQAKEPIEFNLEFKSDSITISLGGHYDPGNWGGTMPDSIEPSGEAWFDSINWLDIDVNIFTIDNGDKIEFTAFKKAPWQIKYLFIKEYLEQFIVDYTKLEIRTNYKNIDIHSVPYC